MARVNLIETISISQKIGFVVVNYNSYDVLEEMLENFIGIQMTSPIIIIDNSENSKMYEQLKNKYGQIKNFVFYMSDSNLGYSRGNNLGIKLLKKEFPMIEFIAIINPDVIFKDKSNFYKMIQYYIDNIESIGIITGVQYLNGEIKIGSKIPDYKDIILSRIPVLSSQRTKIYNKKLLAVQNEKIINVGVVSGCFFVIAYKHFEKIGFFDEEIFLYFEENIISKKLNNNHLKVCVYTDFEFEHNHKWKKWDNKALLQYNQNYSVSEKYYVEKYLNRKTHIIYDAVVYLYTKVYLGIKKKFY